MSAHLFVVYFACLSTITPPVAISSYAAAGIAQASPLHVGFTAMRLGIAAYIVPFMFVYAPSLVLIGSWERIVLAAATALVGTYALARGVQLRMAPALERALMLAAALLLIKPGIYTDLAGGLLISFGFLAHRYLQREKAAPQEALGKGSMDGGVVG